MSLEDISLSYSRYLASCETKLYYYYAIVKHPSITKFDPDV